MLSCGLSPVFQDALLLLVLDLIGQSRHRRQ
jgi:hypothetical protein